MITGLQLDDFRGFKSTGRLEFGKINLFYGPNSGGKSTLLRALSLLKQSFHHNQLDSACPLLPNSREGVDMGTSDSLHHNLDSSRPFSLSISAAGPSSGLWITRQRYNVHSPEHQDDDTPFYAVKNEPKNEPDFYLVSPPDSRPTLTLSIATQRRTSSFTLSGLSFGTPDLSIVASASSSQLGQRKARYGLFTDFFHRLTQSLPPAAFPLDPILAMPVESRRRTRAPKLSKSHRLSQAPDKTYLGCYTVDRVHMSDAYGKAIARYLRDASQDIAGFARSAVKSLAILFKEPTSDSDGNGCPLSPDDQLLAKRLQKYFRDVARFFADESQNDESYARWWQQDLARSKFLAKGFLPRDTSDRNRSLHSDQDADHKLMLEYEDSSAPPMAAWLGSESWHNWMSNRNWLISNPDQGWTVAMFRQRSPRSFRILSAGDWDCDDACSLYESTFAAVGEALGSLRAIGPDRTSAERVYRVEPRQIAENDYVGRNAAEVPRLLYESSRNLDRPDLIVSLNNWLAHAGIPYRVDIGSLEIHAGRHRRQSGLFEITARLPHSPDTLISLCDVGHGIYKQLALPLQIFLGRKLIITIEEPETNVHPRLQAEIADLFIDAVLNREHQIFAEAHSEILSLRLRRRIAEGQISHKDVRLFYVYAPDNGPSVVLPLALDEKGHLINEPPGGFFDEWLNEV